MLSAREEEVRISEPIAMVIWGWRGRVSCGVFAGEEGGRGGRDFRGEMGMVVKGL